MKTKNFTFLMKNIGILKIKVKFYLNLNTILVLMPFLFYILGLNYITYFNLNYK